MRPKFPLFQSHLDLAHAYWKMVLREGDWAIDATCGNGKDTLKLAELLLKKNSTSGIIAIDIQQQAIENTKSLIESSLSQEEVKNIFLFHSSHEDFPSLTQKHPIRLIVYNLGYLPGSDKQIKTHKSTTLTSIHHALSLLTYAGVLSITCYPGHLEGKEEEKALINLLNELNPLEYSACHHRFLNRKDAPSLVIVQKQSNH